MDTSTDAAEWLRVTLSSIGDAVITTDPQGRVTMLNPIAQELTGWTQQDAVGLDLTEVFHIVNQETREVVENPALRALREGVVVALANHTVLIAQDGTERNIDDSAAPIKSDAGEVAGAVLVFRDITERYQQEKLVADGRAYAENILRTLRHPFLVLDSDLRVVSANRSFYKNFEVEPEATEGRLVYELGDGQWNVPKLRELLEEILPKNGHTVEDFEVEHEFPEIGRKVMSLNARRVNRPGNHSELILLVIEDITERRKAEEALHDTDARFRLMSEATQQKVFTSKSNGDVDYFNPEWTHYTGLSFEQIRDWGWTQFIHPDDVDENVRVWKHSIDTGEPFAFEHRFRRADGEYRWHVSRAVPVRDEAGGVINWVGSNTDVHDIKQADEKLRASEESYRTLFETVPVAVFVCDDMATVQYYNKRAVELWGREPECGVERHCGSQTLYLPSGDLLPHEQSPMMEVLRTGAPVKNVEVLIGRPDGSRIPVIVNFAPIKDAEGRVTGVITSFDDITALKTAQESLSDSETRYRRLFQSAKDGILILDAHTGKITDANAFMGGLVGQEAHEMLGKELHEIGMFGDVEASKSAFRELQENGYLRYEHLPVKNQHGGSVEVEVVANVYQEDNTLVAQCNVRDISQRVVLEKKIQEQIATIADQSRRKDEFLAMLSHELRNPLAPISSALHLLMLQEKIGENPAQKQAHEIIERQVANLTKIVSDLLEVSRVVSGRIRINAQTLDLNQVVKHAVQTSDPLIKRRRHTLSVNLCPEAAWVHADPTRLEEVLVNLLNNAAKYTDEGGKIEVTAECDKDSALIRVRDNGIGIDEELLPHIFDLFTQADRSLDRSQGGLGIGLSLAHRLIEMHGGSIEAKSGGPGQGSEFVVRLSLVPGPTTVEPTETAVPTDRQEGVRVLIIDDNADLVLMISAVLQDQGYRIQTASDGPGGLKLAGQWGPDVVLLDIGLPGLDGYEVARRLRSAPETSGARLIALTGYGRDTDVALALEAGFDSHITKPFAFDDLVKLMAEPVKD